MAKILANYPQLTALWPILRAETKDSTALAKIIGIEAKMKQFSFLYGTCVMNEATGLCDLR